MHANALADMCVCYVPETGAVLAQGIENSICDVCTARHTQRLQPMAPTTDGYKTFICDLLLDSHTETYLDEEPIRLDIFAPIPCMRECECVCLTEHVCKLSVTSSGQCAPICLSASSSNYKERKHKRETDNVLLNDWLDLKRQYTKKFNFCPHLLTVMLFQTHGIQNEEIQ